jgi:hypothetical protein
VRFPTRRGRPQPADGLPVVGRLAGYLGVGVDDALQIAEKIEV